MEAMPVYSMTGAVRELSRRFPVRLEVHPEEPPEALEGLVEGPKTKNPPICSS